MNCNEALNDYFSKMLCFDLGTYKHIKEGSSNIGETQKSEEFEVCSRTDVFQ